MRLAILAILASFWISAGTATAKNGETGILLIIQKYEFIPDSTHDSYILLLCSEDLERISLLIENGFETKVLLLGRGVYEIEATDDGNFRLYKENIEINARDCHPSLLDC